MSVQFLDIPSQWQAGATQVIALQADLLADVVVQVSRQQTPGLTIERVGDQGMLTYHSVSDLMRALTLWLGHAQQLQTFTFTEQAKYDMVGVMIDVARNAVPKVSTLKQAFVRLASLGYTEVWLYLEDVFEIPGVPYFGHQRGRYSQSDLHELALAADAVGLTLVPAVQTLAHLRNLLKWQAFDDIRDAPDCLYVEKPETTNFLRQLLKAASAPFLTKKIHIGMDEAYNLGRDRLLRERGLISQQTLMVAHLKTVVSICNELGLKPAMWSDMWFISASPTHQLYDPDTKFTQALVASIPPVTQVYWDYYHAQTTPYTKMFALHAQLKQPVIFASGLWTWNGLAPTTKTMQATLKAGMQAADDAGIRQVVTTMWGDDGSEVFLQAAWFALQTFAEYQYHDIVSEQWAADQFALMQGRVAQGFELLDRFENLAATSANLSIDDPAKILLYEDLLLQRYAVNFQGFDLVAHYQQLHDELVPYAVGPDQALFAYYVELAQTLSLKAQCLRDLQQLLPTGVAALADVQAHLHALREHLQRLIAMFRSLWHHERRGPGYEIMDLRLNGLLGRIDTTLWRLDEWQAGRDDLAELSAPRLLMDKHTSGAVGRGRYLQIISACGISQNV